MRLRAPASKVRGPVVKRRSMREVRIALEAGEATTPELEASIGRTLDVFPAIERGIQGVLAPFARDNDEDKHDAITMALAISLAKWCKFQGCGAEDAAEFFRAVLAQVLPS